MDWPNRTSDTLPHSLFKFTFVRSQSGMKLLLLSVHGRVTLLTVVLAGLKASAYVVVSDATYRPRLAFTAAFPVPKTSNAALIRGFRSFQQGTQSKP